MTSQLDFDRSLTAWLEENGVPTTPDYLDDLLTVTRRTRQRSAWASLERWLPVQLSLSRPMAAVPRGAWLLLMLGLIIALLAAGLTSIGAHRVPPPLGLARNGVVAVADQGRIALITPDGGRAATVTPNDEVADRPAFSPDGTRVAYYSWPIRTGVDPTVGAGPPIYDSPDQPIGSVVVINVDGSGRTVLARNLTLAAPYASSIAWSHDGRRIAFSYRPPGAQQGHPTIDVVSIADGGTSHMGSGDSPAWSPDDTLLAGRVEGTGVFVGPSDGSRPLELVSHAQGSGFAFSSPAWSPDGKRLAYYTGVDGMHDIYTVNRDGTDERPYSTDPQDEFTPVYSPDGTRLAFERVADPAGDDHFVVGTADGKILRELETPMLAPGPYVWSPDGRYLIGTVVNAEQTGTDGLLFVDVTDPTRSIRILGVNGDMSWQRLAP